MNSEGRGGELAAYLKADSERVCNESQDQRKMINIFSVFSSETIKIRQAQVEKLYAGLKDLGEERRGKLDETLKLYQLNREVDDLELWIADKEVIAKSQDVGQDLAQCEVNKLLWIRSCE